MKRNEVIKKIKDFTKGDYIDLFEIEEKIGNNRLESILEDSIEFILFSKRFIGLPESEKDKIKVYVDLWSVEEPEDVEDGRMPGGDAGFIIDFEDDDIFSGNIVFELLGGEVLQNAYVKFEEI